MLDLFHQFQIFEDKTMWTNAGPSNIINSATTQINVIRLGGRKIGTAQIRVAQIHMF